MSKNPKPEVSKVQESQLSQLSQLSDKRDEFEKIANDGVVPESVIKLKADEKTSDNIEKAKDLLVNFFQFLTKWLKELTSNKEEVRNSAPREELVSDNSNASQEETNKLLKQLLDAISNLDHNPTSHKTPPLLQKQDTPNQGRDDLDGNLSFLKSFPKL